MRLRWIAETDVAAPRALATGAFLLSHIEENAEAPAILYGATLTGSAIALGQNQRAPQAIDAEAAAEAGVTLLRRATGGPAAMAGDGILYGALALRHASVLMECPKDRVLNRNVRGFLGGLSKGGEAAHYFGREWLAVARRPAAYVGWTRTAEGAVLLEVFAALSSPFVVPDALSGYPPREEPLGGKEPITLAEAWPETHGAEDAIRFLAEGHEERYEGVELERASLADDQREAVATLEPRVAVDVVDEAEDGLSWSKPREIPIGFVSAGVGVGTGGHIADARVAGDFYQDAEAPEFLRQALLGKPATGESFVEAVNETWDGNARVIEGLKELQPILEALMEAAER